METHYSRSLRWFGVSRGGVGKNPSIVCFVAYVSIAQLKNVKLGVF